MLGLSLKRCYLRFRLEVRTLDLGAKEGHSSYVLLWLKNTVSTPAQSRHQVVVQDNFVVEGIFGTKICGNLDHSCS